MGAGFYEYRNIITVCTCGGNKTSVVASGRNVDTAYMTPVLGSKQKVGVAKDEKWAWSFSSGVPQRPKPEMLVTVSE